MASTEEEELSFLTEKFARCATSAKVDKCLATILHISLSLVNIHTDDGDRISCYGKSDTFHL